MGAGRRLPGWQSWRMVRVAPRARPVPPPNLLPRQKSSWMGYQNPDEGSSHHDTRNGSNPWVQSGMILELACRQQFEYLSIHLDLANLGVDHQFGFLMA